MTISREFAQAVQDKNLLRVRIMLKDSLLVDKTFSLFDEMQQYASSRGLNPWANSYYPLEKAAKPWTEDTMNYELTALVNDFTKEHVDYVKAIISHVYKLSISLKQDSYVKLKSQEPETQKEQSAGLKNYRTASNSSPDDLYDVIILESKRIRRILKNNEDEYSGKRRWLDKDIDSIGRHAQKIVDTCAEIQRRG